MNLEHRRCGTYPMFALSLEGFRSTINLSPRPLLEPCPPNQPFPSPNPVLPPSRSRTHFDLCTPRPSNLSMLASPLSPLSHRPHSEQKASKQPVYFQHLTNAYFSNPFKFKDLQIARGGGVLRMPLMIIPNRSGRRETSAQIPQGMSSPPGDTSLPSICHSEQREDLFSSERFLRGESAFSVRSLVASLPPYFAAHISRIMDHSSRSLPTTHFPFPV